MNNVSHISAFERPASRARVAEPAKPARKPFEAKGHDRQLQDAQNNKRHVDITLISGDHVTGVIERRDRYTVTVQLDEGHAEHQGKSLLVFKHGIETVLIDRAPGASKDDSSED